MAGKLLLFRRHCPTDPPMFTDTHCHLADPALLPQLPEVLAAARAGERCAVLSCPPPAAPIGRRYSPWVRSISTAPSASTRGLPLRPVPMIWPRSRSCSRNARKPWWAKSASIFCTKPRQTKRARGESACLNSNCGWPATPPPGDYPQSQSLRCHCGRGARHPLQPRRHCARVSGSLEEAQAFIRCGFKIGIGSLLLNPAAKKARQAAAALSLEHIVLKTDSPFMLKNETNTPAECARHRRNRGRLARHQLGGAFGAD